MVVLEDADLEVTIPGTAMGIFANHGQNCCAGSRLFVHECGYDVVVDGIARIARDLRLGPSLNKSTQMGPLVSARQQERVLGYVRSGKMQLDKMATYVDDARAVPASSRAESDRRVLASSIR